MDADQLILKFDAKKFPFHKVLSNFLNKENLADLTFNSSDEPPATAFSFYKNMEQSHVFKNLYQILESEQGKAFYDLYQKFIKEVIRPQFSEGIYYQRIPSHRILFKDIKGTAKFHKDSDYGHKTTEINYWLPQTRAFDSNSIWIAPNNITREPADHIPITLEVGECLRFNGTSVSHGAVENTSGHTRVSFDFRVIPESTADTRLFDEVVETTDKNPVMSNAKKFAYCG